VETPGTPAASPHPPTPATTKINYPDIKMHIGGSRLSRSPQAEPRWIIAICPEAIWVWTVVGGPDRSVRSGIDYLAVNKRASGPRRSLDRRSTFR